MPWRLIVVVVLMGILIAFIGLNLENRADVSFGFHTFEQIPIFISLFVSFITGVVVMLPFTIGRRRNRKKKEKSLPEKQLEKPKKKRGFRKSKNKGKDPVSGETTVGPSDPTT